MPWRMVGLLVTLLLVAIFATLNLEYRSNVSFGFREFEDVPIFLSTLLSFIAGAVVMLPFTLRRRRRQMAAGAEREVSEQEQDRKPSRRERRRLERAEAAEQGRIGALETDLGAIGDDVGTNTRAHADEPESADDNDLPGNTSPLGEPPVPSPEPKKKPRLRRRKSSDS